MATRNKCCVTFFFVTKLAKFYSLSISQWLSHIGVRRYNWVVLNRNRLDLVLVLNSRLLNLLLSWVVLLSNLTLILLWSYIRCDYLIRSSLVLLVSRRIISLVFHDSIRSLYAVIFLLLIVELSLMVWVWNLLLLNKWRHRLSLNLTCYSTSLLLVYDRHRF